MHHDFFKGVEQLGAKMGGKKVKLPVFYRSARAMTAVFPALVPSLKKLIPDSRYKTGDGSLFDQHITLFDS